MAKQISTIGMRKLVDGEYHLSLGALLKLVGLFRNKFVQI
jgi:hypothetical protein